MKKPKRSIYERTHPKKGEYHRTDIAQKEIKHKFLELPPFLSIFANHNKVMRTK